MRACLSPGAGSLVFLVSVLALLSGGCSKANLVGEWRMTRCVPNREVFSFERIAFAEGGAYDAKLCLDGRRAEEAGRYDFDGFYLYLMPSGGGRRKFDAYCVGSTLEIGDGKERRAYLRRSTP